MKPKYWIVIALVLLAGCGYIGPLPNHNDRTCMDCGGSGEIQGHRCQRCNGWGVVNVCDGVERHFQVKNEWIKP